MACRGPLSFLEPLVLLLASPLATAAATSCSPERCAAGGTPTCPISTGVTSQKAIGLLTAENLYLRNAAPFSAEILRVDERGQEVSLCVQPYRRAARSRLPHFEIARSARAFRIAR